MCVHKYQPIFVLLKRSWYIKHRFEINLDPTYLMHIGKLLVMRMRGWINFKLSCLLSMVFIFDTNNYIITNAFGLFKVTLFNWKNWAMFRPWPFRFLNDIIDIKKKPSSITTSQLVEGTDVYKENLPSFDTIILKIAKIFQFWIWAIDNRLYLNADKTTM